MLSLNSMRTPITDKDYDFSAAVCPPTRQFAKTLGTTEQWNAGSHRWKELNIAVSFNSGYLYFRLNKAFHEYELKKHIFPLFNIH